MINYFKKTRLIALSVSFCLFTVSLFGSPQQEEDAAGVVTTDVLTVYTYDVFPEVLQDALVEHFDTAFGVRVEVERFADTGGIYNQLVLEKDASDADVMIGLDNTYLADLLEDDMLLSYRPEDLDLVNPSLLIDPSFKAIPFDFGRIVLNYNKDLLPDPPETWEELLDPALREKIILMNPATASPGRNFLLYTIAAFGEEHYLDFWRKLKPNILTITDGWSEGYALYTQGEAPIVLSYDTSPAYHIHYEDDVSYDNIIFNNQAYAQIEIAGILKTTDNLKNAKRCIDFIVSKEFQELIPLNQIMYPIHPAVDLPPAFRQINTAENIVNLDESAVAQKFDIWLSEWESVMQ